MRTNNEQAFLRELAILIKKERIAKGKSRDALAEVVNLSTRGIEEFDEYCGRNEPVMRSFEPPHADN